MNKSVSLWWLIGVIVALMLVGPVTAAEVPPDGTKKAPCTVPSHIFATRPDSEEQPACEGLYVIYPGNLVPASDHS